MRRVAQFAFIALVLGLPAVASAGPADDANVAVDRWSAAYSSNDPESIAKNYWPDAILLGTVSPVISEGTEAIVAYFTPTKGSGNKNAIDERRTIVVDDSVVVVTGFYTLLGLSMANLFLAHRDSPCLSPSAEMNGAYHIIILRRMFCRRTEVIYRCIRMSAECRWVPQLHQQ
jgi:hypothetical protein